MKMLDLKRLLIPLVSMLSAPTVGAEEPHKPGVISEVDTYYAYSVRASLGDCSFRSTVSFEVASQSYDRIPLELLYSREYIKGALVDSLNNLKRFNRGIGIAGEHCIASNDLDIFVLSEDTMFSSGLFREYLSQHRSHHSIVYAFYDPTPEDKDSVAIIISNTNWRDNYFYLQHELAHYWWDVMRLGDGLNADTEEYATYFEQFLRSKM